MIINHNISAVFVNRILSKNEKKISRSIERLASGLRINSAADDASGLAVSEKLKSQIQGMKQAERNALTGISFIQTGEGALQEVHAILHRIRELAVQAANAIYSREDRELVQIEVSQLVQEVNRIAKTTEFNGLKILDGSQKHLILQVGPNQGQTITVGLKTMTAGVLGISGISLSTANQANKSIKQIDEAINLVSMQRAKFGATQNRLEHVVSQLSIAEENLQAAESHILDTDIANEVINFTRLKILEETGIAMLMQANLKPQSVLELLD